MARAQLTTFGDDIITLSNTHRKVYLEREFSERKSTGGFRMAYEWLYRTVWLGSDGKEYVKYKGHIHRIFGSRLESCGEGILGMEAGIVLQA